MKKRIFALAAIALLAGGFYLYQRTEWAGSTPVAIATGSGELPGEQEAENGPGGARGLKLEIEHAQDEAEMLRHGTPIPGRLSQSDLAMSIAALQRHRAQLALLAPEHSTALAQVDRDIRTLRQAEAELAARGYRE